MGQQLGVSVIGDKVAESYMETTRAELRNVFKQSTRSFTSEFPLHF